MTTFGFTAAICSSTLPATKRNMSREPLVLQEDAQVSTMPTRRR